jgi:hypothetical protein
MGSYIELEAEDEKVIYVKNLEKKETNICNM